MTETFQGTFYEVSTIVAVILSMGACLTCYLNIFNLLGSLTDITIKKIGILIIWFSMAVSGNFLINCFGVMTNLFNITFMDMLFYILATAYITSYICLYLVFKRDVNLSKLPIIGLMLIVLIVKKVLVYTTNMFTSQVINEKQIFEFFTPLVSYYILVLLLSKVITPKLVLKIQTRLVGISKAHMADCSNDDVAINIDMRGKEGK